jgi:hypothetical protein
MDSYFEILHRFGLIYILRRNITVTQFVALTGHFTECIEPGIGDPGSVRCVEDRIKHNIRASKQPQKS